MPNTLTLADLVAPADVSSFLREIQGGGHRLFTGEAGRFAHLMPWPALNEILERNRIGPPRLRLARDGAMLDPEGYFDRIPLRDGSYDRRLLPGPFTERLRAGATLVLDAVEELHGPIGALATALERDLREQVQINLYASWGTSHGFERHWDNHDVLAVQLAGRKRWRLYGSTRQFPILRDVVAPEPPDREPVAECVLEDGDVLYVPRGHWHDVAALDGPSLHLTCGFAPATGIDLAEWLVDRLRADELFRRDLPRFAGPESRLARTKALRAALDQLMRPEVIDHFLADHDARSSLRPGLSLPWAATPDILPPPDRDAMVQLLVPRAEVRAAGNGTVALLAVGHQWIFAEEARPVLAALSDGEPKTIAALCALPDLALDEGTVRALLAELTVGGLLVIR
jgi:hypothetical protein